MTFNIKAAIIELIKATSDPTSPVKMQEAYQHVERLGTMFGTTANKTGTSNILEAFLDTLPEDISGIEPEIITAVSAILTEVMVHYVIRLTKEQANAKGNIHKI